MHKINKLSSAFFCFFIIHQSTYGQELSIFLATSLKPVISALLVKFNQQQPNLKFKLQAQGSHVLKFQIENGAAADVFLSADFNHIKTLYNKNLIDKNNYGNFATGKIVIATSPYYTKKITDIKTLIESDATLVLASKDSPLGKYTNQIMVNFSQTQKLDIDDDILSKVVSYEQNSAHTLTKLNLGAADAAFLYNSDVAKSNLKISYSIIDDSYQPNITYGYAIIKSSLLKFEAKQLINFLKSQKASEILKQYGMEKL